MCRLQSGPVDVREVQPVVEIDVDGGHPVRLTSNCHAIAIVTFILLYVPFRLL